MPDTKHVNKFIKQEDGKGESAGPAVSNIPAEALNRLIAMGGPPGEQLLSSPLTLFAALPQRCQYTCAAIYMSELLSYLCLTHEKLLAKTGQGLVCDILFVYWSCVNKPTSLLERQTTSANLLFCYIYVSDMQQVLQHNQEFLAFHAACGAYSD